MNFMQRLRKFIQVYRSTWKNIIIYVVRNRDWRLIPMDVWFVLTGK